MLSTTVTNSPALKALYKITVIFSVIWALTACQAMHTAVKKRNLDVQTKMSETIFLEPVSPSKRIAYVDFRNTSDKELPVKDLILNKIQANGFKLTDDPEQANYMLQVNVLQVGKSDLRASQDALTAGFGGAAIGAGAGALGSSSGRDVVGMGLLGAAAGVIGDALVDDTLYTMITDVQVRERPLKGEIVTQTQATNASQGTSTRLHQSTSGAEVNWKTYRTRIVSTANKANLDFEEAVQPLMDGLVRSIGGIL